MEHQDKVKNSGFQLAWGHMVGLMFTGAVVGVAAFGAGIAIFDAVRDRMGLQWSAGLVALVAIVLLGAAAVTIGGCGLLAYLINSLAGGGIPSLARTANTT